MDVDKLYESLAEIPVAELSGWQDAFMKFYRAWFYEDRWKSYFEGLVTTIEVTVIALAIGVVLGLLVAMIRTAHDQQRPERRNFILGALNFLARIYVTAIRGTPMLVQLMIMGFVIFANSREFTMIGALSLGINSGAYGAEIIRGGLMSLDVGQTEAGRSLGLGYIDTMRFIVIPQAFKAILPALGNEFIVLLKDTSLISAIYAAAPKVKDYPTMQFLDWFVKEQGEEEKNADDLVKKMKLFGGDPKGLYLLDQELAARVYTPSTPTGN